MPAVGDEGVCLRHWDWSETSQTVSLFGRSLGVIRGLAKGARRERSAFGGGIDLLARGAFGAIVRSGSELATLTEWDLLETFPALRERLPRNRAAFYAADLIQRMVPAGDPHPVLYDAFVRLLRTLGESASRDPSDEAGATESTSMALALLQFQWGLLVEAGFQPAVDAEQGAATTLWFDPHGGTFLLERPAGPAWRVRRETIDLLARVSRSEPLHPMPDQAPAEAVDRANRLLAAYIREIIQTEPPTLKDLFGTLGVSSTGLRPRSM